MLLYTDNNNNIYKSDVNLCLDIDIDYRLVDATTNNYKILNAKNLSIYNNTKLIDYLHASGGTYTTASAEQWKLPDKLYGYMLGNCGGNCLNASPPPCNPQDWVGKGDTSNASSAKQLNGYNPVNFCNSFKNQNFNIQDIKTSFTDMPQFTAGILRIPISPYILFKDMNILDKEASINNLSEAGQNYIELINYYARNKIYCLVDAFHSDNYNLCSINISSTALSRDKYRPLVFNGIPKNLEKGSPSNKYQPLSGNQFKNAWTIIAQCLLNKCTLSYIIYVILELCNEPNGQMSDYKALHPWPGGKIIEQPYCNNILNCNDGGAGNSDINKINICQHVYNNNYQIPAIKAIRSVSGLTNIPILVTNYNTWSGLSWIDGTFPWAGGAEHYLKVLISDLSNAKLISKEKGSNNIIFNVHKYCDYGNSGSCGDCCGTIFENGPINNTISTLNQYLNPYDMKWFISEGAYCTGNLSRGECYPYFLTRMDSSTNFLGYTLYWDIGYLNDTNNNPVFKKIYNYNSSNKITNFGNYKSKNSVHFKNKCIDSVILDTAGYQ